MDEAVKIELTREEAESLRSWIVPSDPTASLAPVWRSILDKVSAALGIAVPPKIEDHGKLTTGCV